MADLFYPQSLEDALDQAWEENAAVSAIKFDIHQREDSGTSHLLKSIWLYIPEALANPTNVTWDSQGIGIAAQSVMADAGWKTTAENVFSTYGSKAMNYAVDMAGKLTGGGAAGQDLLALDSKAAINPFMKMLFRNVNFRNFEFLFRFTPHNEDESPKIYEIIQEFRAAALPSTSEAGESCGTPDPLAFKVGYPRELEIGYIYQGEEHPWLNKFKRCVITDLNVNYTGAGFYASMRDGFPAQTELRMAFSEIEMVYREDICTDKPSY